MILVQGCSYICRERFSVVLPDSFLSPKLKFAKQPTGPLRPKSPTTTTDVSKYSKDDLQQIFKTVLEVQAPMSTSAPIPALAAAAFEKPRNKPLKARSPNVYYAKSHMDCYNFCQQCEDYFATTGTMRLNQIPFTTFFLQDRIIFR